MRRLRVSVMGLLVVAGAANADDLSGTLPTKAPAAPYDWNGFYLGAHLGYALGSPHWSSTQAGASGPSGTIDFSNAFNFSTGNGSYLVGLQAGYNHMSASNWLFGWETDISFPNAVGGNSTFISAVTGQANYSELVEMSGSLRGRVGYAPGSWLFYATAGFAWSFDQFSRIQLAGVPAGRTAVPSTIENLFLVPRVGGVVGVGTEVALTPQWTALFEYLFTDYANRSVTFPAAAQRFDSAASLHTLRVGLDYKLGRDGVDFDTFNKGISALELERFALRGQTTLIEQYDPPFRSPYLGPHSLDPNQGRESWDIMYFVGLKLWQGAEFWVDPEIDQGFGLSNTEGIAGFPSGASFKVGSSVPYSRIQRYFVRQTIDLGGDSQKIPADQNQFASSNTIDRLVISIGKYSVSDVFDQNKYAQNPRKDFMNWALIDAGAFDYAADAWGYTYGAAVEWYEGQWTLRAGVFDLSTAPNNADLDPSFAQFQWLGEIERRYDLWGHPGKLAVTSFLTRARLGTYQDAITLAQETGGPADIAAVRQYRSRTGLSGNLEQEITSNLGVFARAGFANGNVEPDSYTDIDRTVAAGLSLKGKQWGRPDDTIAIASVGNGISAVHKAFLNDGGLGILVGDSKLPHPSLEHVIEAYYLFPIFKWNVTIDYQFVVNPAYNRDRGPVSIMGVRAETDF